jgi:CBS domain-containing protein
MRARDVMSGHPVTVTADEVDTAAIAGLMDDAGTRHLPILDGDRLAGAWIADPDAGVARIGPDRVAEVAPDADAEEPVRMLLEGAEVVVVRGDAGPLGVITRTDVMSMVRAAMAQGAGRRHPRPTVVRVAGVAGAGKSRLIRRTAAALSGYETVVVQANPSGSAAAGDVREVRDTSAHWRAGLARVVRELADAELVLLEDRDEDIDLARGIGEDVQVAVTRLDAAGSLTPERLGDAQAVVLTRADEAGADAVRDAVEAVAARCPGLAVMAVGSSDDEAFAAWVRWVGRQVLRRRG